MGLMLDGGKKNYKWVFLLVFKQYALSTFLLPANLEHSISPHQNKGSLKGK